MFGPGKIPCGWVKVHLYYSESDINPDWFTENPIECLH